MCRGFIQVTRTGIYSEEIGFRLFRGLVQATRKAIYSLYSGYLVMVISTTSLKQEPRLCKPPCLRNSLHPVLSGPQDTLPRLVPDAPDHRLNVPGFWSTILEYFFIGPVP